MSEQNKNSPERNKTDKNPITIKYIGSRALIAVGIAGSAIALMGANQSEKPDLVIENKPHKVYTAKPGDTEWGIGNRAYPGMDGREASDVIDQKNPNEAHLVTPGQKFELGMDSEIGRVVDPAEQHLGSGAEG